MKPISSLTFEYRGKAGGVEADKNDDVLTLQRGTSKRDIVFGRAGNNSGWQKLRNAANQKTLARFDDVVDFLKSRGMSSKNAKSAAQSIKTDNGQFRARDFEHLLMGKSTNQNAPRLTENEVDLFAYKAEHGSQWT